MENAFSKILNTLRDIDENKMRQVLTWQYFFRYNSQSGAD